MSNRLLITQASEAPILKLIDDLLTSGLNKFTRGLASTSKEMDGDIEKDYYDDGIEVEEFGDSQYRTQFHVSKQYFGIIHGKQAQTKSRIEQDTKTEIKIPQFGQNGDIVILGSSATNVKAARRQINTIVVSSRMNKRPTHFISIPMNKPDVMENFTQFQEAVLRDCKSDGIDESIFIKASKVHLTMGVMCLMDNEERMLASKLLTEAKEKVIMPLLQGHLPVKIRIKGLSYMRDDPKHMHVLYAKVEELETSGILQQSADGVVDYFNKKGLMKKGEYGRDTVQLHVTLLNTKYRKTSLTQTSSQDVRASSLRQRRKSFDGTEILEKFGDFEFGVMELSEIHLSLRGATGPDGYYQPTFIISIP